MKKTFLLLFLVNCAQAAPLALSQSPLFLMGTVTPNVLVILDNSESMDGTMSGMLIAGSDPATRGNIGREVIRNTISNYRTAFNWGLMSYAAAANPTLYNTYAYYLGDAATMVFTNDCVNGISESNGGLRCIANPQPFSGANYLTYQKSGDDPEINDVLYTGNMGGYAWGVGVNNSSHYSICGSHRQVSSWGASDFTSCNGPYGFTPTDAGFLPASPPYPRQLWLNRAWGYYAGVSGAGSLNERVLPDSSTHFTRLTTLLADETNAAGSEIKNAAVYTPVAGTFATAKQYFAGTGGYTSPISASCQKNFALFVTDGKPTANTSGNMYPLTPDQVNSYSGGNWSFGNAATQAIGSIAALKSTTSSAYPGITFDIPTYVVALGSTVQNADSIAVMNAMAQAGGTGNAYLATDQNSLQNAIQGITANIAALTAASSSIALNSGTLSSNSKLYQAKFQSGDWSGQILAYPIGQNGAPGAVAWDAGQIINTQNYNNGRAILSYKPSAAIGNRGIAFRWPANPASPAANEMDSSQAAALNLNAAGTADGFGSQRLDYLRGSSANECAGCSPQFRARSISKLGDIIDSAPYYLDAPAFNYRDNMESVAYSSFYNQYRNRRAMIYVGANDGMLHAFDASNGSEVFAYVPSTVYSNLSQLTSTAYSHRYYVDGSPSIGDVFYGGQWHTLLAGGLSAGGKGIYTLDITDPARFSENLAASVVRWEFTANDDADLGYTFGQPSIVKLNNGRWGVIFGNGYNNSGSGHGVIYILDAETGALIKKFDCGIGSTSTPDGITMPTLIDTNGDSIADIVYAGDLYGNLWKLDISAGNTNSWGFAFGNNQNPAPLFAAGSSSTDTTHAISGRADVGLNPGGGFMVYFGTGRYVDSSDNSSTAVQSFYGIIDQGAAVSAASLVAQSVIGSGSGSDSNTYRFTSHAVGPPSPPPAYPGVDNQVSLATYSSSKKGWYINLPASGERNITDPILRGGKIIFSTMIPNTGQCSFGGSGWVMELDALTGNRIDFPVFDSNSSNTVTSGDLLDFTFGGVSGKTTPTGRMTSGIPASPSIMQRPAQAGAVPTENKYVNTSTGVIVQVIEFSGTLASGRVSWQQLR